ncbi:hypothetical protein BJV82DRAFT_672163 [Fennellomyces sp. T-0311]|nr:hypothetical protein BJV82DRAFT_672163 [Fennellomyces sp. T-0311]
MWYFAQEELEEIGNHCVAPILTLLTKVIRHLQSFQVYDPGENTTDKKTVQQLMSYKVDNSALDLEDDYDLRGKTSTTSVNRHNDARIVAGTESMIGHRGDLIFVYSKVELKCGDLGRYNEGAEGSKGESSKVDRFIGLTLQMLVMDSPTGNVCRIRRTKRYDYPKTVGLFQSSVLPMYEMVLKAKAIMLGNIRILESPPARQAQTVDFAPVTCRKDRITSTVFSTLFQSIFNNKASLYHLDKEQMMLSLDKDDVERI